MITVPRNAYTLGEIPFHGITEASILGFKPGEWPDAIEVYVDDIGKEKKTFYRMALPKDHMWERGLEGGRIYSSIDFDTLTVFND